MQRGFFILYFAALFGALFLLSPKFDVLEAAGVFQALPKKAPSPKENPSTSAKIRLGRMLYFDPRLSKTGTVSCNSCHNVMGSGTDNAQFSTGIEGLKGDRNAPTVWNAAFLTTQFWDGRAPTLEEQAKGPLINPVEMGMENHDAVMAKVRAIAGYRKEFTQAFPGEKDPMTIDNLAKAIAAYERTLITPDSPFDRYLRGEKKALSPAAVRGMKLVQAVGCLSCHSGPNFSGPGLGAGKGFFMKFPTVPGTEYEKKYGLADDPGRYKVTKNEADRHMWRVPTWRNVALTAPYFHNGSVESLDEAVRVMAKTQLNRDLEQTEVEDMVDFLKSLTGTLPKQEAPKLPE